MKIKKTACNTSSVWTKIKKILKIFKKIDIFTLYKRIYPLKITPVFYNNFPIGGRGGSVVPPPPYASGH